MKNGKFSRKAKKSNAKLLAVLVSVVLVTALAVSATIAYLMDKTEDVTNTFTLAQVTSKVDEPTFNGKTKSDVPITNTSDVEAYIRAEIIVTWMAEDGNVLHMKPVSNLENSENYDYTLSIGNGWKKVGDYYYYMTSVAAGKDTGALIASAAPVEGKCPEENYYLSLEIICSAIQADGKKTDGTKAVVDAWGIDPSTLGQTGN